MIRIILRLSLCLLLLPGCDRQSAAPASGLAIVDMKLGSRSYALEIAAKSMDRNKGLMYRDSMPADHGMIFIFAKPADQSFWMHNTRIPLDIVYLDERGKVVSIHRMEPYVEQGTMSKAPAMYAVELNAGEARKAGVKEGDTLQVPERARNVIADP